MHNNFDLFENTLHSIVNQNLTSGQFKSLEVIAVDDGSQVRGVDSLSNYFENILGQKGIRFNFVRLHNNMGRAVARNTGADIANGDLLIFLDSDVALERNYLKETIIRHQFLDKIVLVGFKENIELNDSKTIGDNHKLLRKPVVDNDFRFNKVITKDWVGLHPVGTLRTVNCIKETDSFKNFGYGRTVGPFDLPCMVVSHNMSVKHNEFFKAGGFEKKLSLNWGFEDTYLGAKLIARGNYVIPLLSTGVFHIEHASEEKTNVKKDKYREMNHNFKIYKELINRELISNEAIDEDDHSW